LQYPGRYNSLLSDDLWDWLNSLFLNIEEYFRGNPIQGKLENVLEYHQQVMAKEAAEKLNKMLNVEQTAM